MVRYAAEMMLEPAVLGESAGAPVTNWLLSGITYLDEWGAWEWNLRWTSLVWVVVFGLIRFFLAERGGINWYALMHAIITGIGGAVCSYLSFVSAEHMTGTPEPLGTVLCHGPLTSLHRILPTAAVGFSVFDLLDGMRMGADFLSHGAVMFLFSAYVMEVDKNEVLAVMLTLEVSSIFLNFVRCTFMPSWFAMTNMVVFAVSFFFVRIVFGPYAIYQHSYLLYTVGRTSEESSCLPRGFDHVIFITGMFFNILNAFWFYKILRKMQRKLKGTEGMHSNNKLGNSKDSPKLVKVKNNRKEQD